MEGQRLQLTDYGSAAPLGNQDRFPFILVIRAGLRIYEGVLKLRLPDDCIGEEEVRKLLVMRA